MRLLFWTSKFASAVKSLSIDMGTKKMAIKMLEHVNIRTMRIAEVEEWYATLLGLEKGYRPPFENKGVWLYANDIPIIHLVEGSGEYTNHNVKMEHFALRATGLKSFLDRLKERGVPFETVRVPEIRILQVYISDPDGNNMHIDFSADEADALGFE